MSSRYEKKENFYQIVNIFLILKYPLATKQHYIDGRTGISYTLQGDYYLPNFILPVEENKFIGRYVDDVIRIIDDKQEVKDDSKKDLNKNNKKIYIIISLIGLVFLIILVIIIIKKRNKKDEI